MGVSTRPSVIDLDGNDFNQCLQEDGIPDVLEARRQAGELQKAARERYSKHVKTLIQVGQTRSGQHSLSGCAEHERRLFFATRSP